MQSEDVEAQELLRKNLNSVLRDNDVINTNFKGFMVDSAQTNWKVYGNGNLNVPMVN